MDKGPWMSFGGSRKVPAKDGGKAMWVSPVRFKTEQFEASLKEEVLSYYRNNISNTAKETTTTTYDRDYLDQSDPF